MINQLRQYFETDPNNTYYISGAPQCYLNGDQNMDVNIGMRIKVWKAWGLAQILPELSIL